MSRPRLALLAALLLTGCAGPRPRNQTGVLTGIDVLERDGFKELAGKRVGLITNPSGQDRLGRSTARVLAEAPNLTLVSLFSPEHGITARNEAAQISSTTVVLAGRAIPVHSLYSGGILGMRPKIPDLEQLDALVFDIQDIGARFYTYLATMGMAMEEAKKAGIEFVVLDRPDPIRGDIVEGPVLDDLSLRKLTPTAYYPVPVRHGMTAGEMALFYNQEVKHPDLEIVRMRGWRRDMWYDQTGLPWTPPSPNMPDLEAATLYPGIGIFEAGNVSVGRGTPLPFRWIGAPWIDGEKLAGELNAALLPGIEFSAQDYTPSKSVYAGTLCRGVRMKVTDRDQLRPLTVFLAINRFLLQDYPDQFRWRWNEVKRMVGTERFRFLLLTGGDREKLRDLFEGEAERFKLSRQPYLLYR